MTKETKTSSRWEKVRDGLNTVHLWLGIGSGLIVFLVCLSGTIYTFSSEITKVTDAERYEVQAGNASPLPVDQLVQLVSENGKGSNVQSILVSSNKSASYQITIANQEGDRQGHNAEAKQSKHNLQRAGNSQPAPERKRGTTFFVNPYTGEILGSGDTSSSAFFMFFFKLHRWLLLDQSIGRPIVGTATMIFVVMILSGFVIWFPKKLKNWRQGLKVKTSGNWKRINHDLHNALGFYAGLFLLIMALTGLTWSFEWYKKGFNDFLGASRDKKETKLISEYTPQKKSSIDTYFSRVYEVTDPNGEFRMMLPSDSLGVVTVMKTSQGFFTIGGADRIYLDQYTARVLKVEKFADKPLNEQIASSIKAIHVGSIYGTLSKIVYFIACLIGTSLPVTGVLIWLNKLSRKRKKKDQRHSVPDSRIVLER